MDGWMDEWGARKSTKVALGQDVARTKPVPPCFSTLGFEPSIFVWGVLQGWATHLQASTALKGDTNHDAPRYTKYTQI